MKRFANATGATAFAAAALLCAAAHAGMGSSNYVQSGLVAHWDAIDNIGPGRHSVLTNRWHSLVNPEHAFEVRKNTAWTRDSLQFYNGSEVFLDGAKSAATFGQVCTNGTLEFCFTRQSNGGSQTLLRSIYDLSLTQCGSGAIALRNDSNAPVFSFKAGHQTLAAVYGEAHTDVTRYIDGLLDTASSEQNWVGGGASGGTWLGRRDTGTYFLGKVQAIRLYNRKLTADEVAANAAVDAVRYGGAVKNTYVWSGGGAAGNWNDPQNWTPNGVPNAGDKADFTLTDKLTISSDLALDEGMVTICHTGAVLSLTGTISGDGGIRLTGYNPLELKGNNTFKGGVWRASFLSAVDLYHDNGLGSGMFYACAGGESGSGNSGSTPLRIKGSSAMTVTNDMYFAHESYISWNGSIYAYCDVSFTGDIFFDDQTRITVVSPGTYMRFKGNVKGKTDRLIVMNTGNHIYYEKPITDGQFYCDGGNTPKVHLLASGNKFAGISATGTSTPTYYLEAVNAMNGKYIQFKTPYGVINLCGNDQTVSALYDNAWVGNSHYVTSTVPATLTLQPGGDYRFGGRFLGAVSLVYNPSAARTYLVSNSVSTTTGFIAVSNGTFQIKKSSFPNLSSLTVASGAKFQVLDAESSLSNPIPLTLGDDTAKISLPAGYRIIASSIMVGDNLLSYGTYAARATAPEGTIPVDWIEGEGQVVYPPPAGTIVWTGAGGDSLASNPANWVGLSESPDFSVGNLTAVFPADAEAFTVTFPAGLSRLRGIVVGATDFTFAAADATSILGVGSAGIAYERIEGVTRTITYNVPIAPIDTQEWAADDEETGTSLKIVMNRPFVDDPMGLGYVTITGGGRYDLYTTNSTYIGDMEINKTAAGGSVYAYGNEPFGPSGTLRVRGKTNTSRILYLNDVVTSKTVALNTTSSTRSTLGWNKGTTIFKGLVYGENSKIDGNGPIGTIVYAGGYGDAQHSDIYLNWAAAGTAWGSGAVVVITNKPFHVGSIQATIGMMHLYAPSNIFSGMGGWDATYSPIGMTANIHFHTNFAFYKNDLRCSITGNSVWDFHGTEQTIGGLNGYNGTAGAMISTNGPGKLNVRQTSGWSTSPTGLKDFWYDGRFKGEMSLGLTGTRRLILRQVSSATGCVDVAESAILCFTNNASWASATNVAVRANGKIEAWNDKVLGRYTDLTLADSGVYEFCGAGPYIQKVRFLWLDGRRRKAGDFNAENSGGRIVGNGIIRVMGDGRGAVLVFK